MAAKHGRTAQPGFLRGLLPFVFLVFSLTGFTQNLHQRITVEADRKPLSAVLEEISRAAGFEFSYNPAAIDIVQPVSLHARSRRVSALLDDLLGPLGIAYLPVEGHVVLKPAKASAAKTGSDASVPAHHTLSGYLRDRATGEVLIGAYVFIREKQTGVMTNGYGFYSLTLPAGTYPVVFSYLGYKRIEQNVTLAQDVRLSLELDEAQVEMQEVEIVAEGTGPDFPASPSGDIRFSRKTLSRLPGFGGDLDIIRAIQSVPGIQSFGDGSALYYVRGGNSDQNLMLIDEVPVYNPSHLFGFFSAFSPDAINDVQIYKGDFPARYGGRLSSVIDIKAREGNMKRFGFSGNIGPYASSLTAEGPIVKEKASFFISGRISTLNWLNNLPVFNKSFDFSFFDLNAKLNWRINDNNRLFFTLYGGQDLFSRYSSAEVNSMGIGWDNLAATLRWNHLFSSRLFANTTLNYSRYNYRLNLPQEQDGDWVSSIANLTFKSDFVWYLNPKNTLRSGIEATYHATNPGNVEQPDGTGAPAPVVSKYHSMEYVLYASDEQKIGRRLSLRYGIRLPLWQDMGPTDVYYFDGNHQVIDTIAYSSGTVYSTRFSPEPRIHATFTLDEQSSVRAGYSRNTQFMQLLTTSISPFTSVEVWVPCGPNIEPQVVDQVETGYSRELFGKRFAFSLEGYYKWFSHRPDYRDHANLLYNPLIEGELRDGSGRSYGVEFMFRKMKGAFTGWVAYTWSRALVQTPGVNGGKSYPAGYDHPNDLCINLSWEDGRHWNVTATWIYMTGGAITTPTGFYYLNGSSVPVYGDRNNDRLPDYHRLDLSAGYQFGHSGQRFRHSLSVSVYNAYGRLNPFTVTFNRTGDGNGGFVVPANQNGIFSLVPTSVSVAGIIPSINYRFKF